jgi:hypothetical protein
VKVFVPGVVRSERAYIERLVANVREWREYEASIQRLYAIEREKVLQIDPNAPEYPIFPPAYEWWMENFALARDISIRKYPARLQSYDEVLREPATVIERIMAWIGTGDVAAAVAAVKPEHRTQTRPESESVEPKYAKVFDDFYGAIASHEGLSGPLLATLNKTNRELMPKLVEMQTVVAKAAMERPARKPEPIEGLPEI